MFLTSLALVILTILSSWFYLYKIRSWNLEKELARRNVKYCPSESVFKVFLQKKRLEVLNDEAVRKHGPVFGFSFLNQLTIMVAEPELLQIVFSKEFHNFINRRKVVSQDPMFALALSAVESEQWKRLRSIVAPTFATGKLRKMKPCLDEIGKNLIDNIRKHLNTESELNIKSFAGTFTMDTIIQVAFGVKVDSMSDPNNPIITMAKKLFNTNMSLLAIFRFALMFIAPKFISKTFTSLTRFNGEVTDFFYDLSLKIIKQKQIEYSNKNFEKATTFIEFLLEANHEYEKQNKIGKENGNQENNENGEEHSPNKYITEDEMIAQCILFFLAGYDTTATTITLACYYMALNPDKQQLAYEEVCRVLDKQHQTPSSGSLESIPFETYQMKFEYITGVINETLRMSPPAFMLERRAMNDCKLQTEDGRLKINVKKDDIIQIPAWSLHYNERYFPEPEKFRPERFCGENKNSFHKYAYLPFGSGPRACVAKSLALLEAKIALVWLVKHFKFERSEKTTVPVEYYKQTILTPKDVILRVKQRK